MAVYDSIINNDSFVSDFFLTSDEKKGTFLGAVQSRVREWKKDEHNHTLARLTDIRGPFLEAYGLMISVDDEDIKEEQNKEHLERLYELIREFIGFGEGRMVESNLAEDAPESKSLEGTWYVASGKHTVFFEAEPVEAFEDIVTAAPRHPIAFDGKPVDWNVSKTLTNIFNLEQPPTYAVAIAGSWLLLASRESWPFGRYLAVNLRWALEQNETKANGLNDIVTCIFALENLRRKADGSCWWDDVLESAKEHTAKVSDSLRHAVRDCVQILGNDVLQRRRAKGLENNNEIADELTREALRYLYRILFILFAEASPELGVLPVGTDEYDRGYGLTRLRNQIMETPNGYKEANGTYLYESLEVLFQNVNGGPEVSEDFAAYYVKFSGVEADIFLESATPHINEVKLSNKALGKILNKLLLTEKQKGKDRGFISYASLGVTELGQVYEGLMSYKGFIAEETLYELAPDGDTSKGSWVYPRRIVADDEEKYPIKDIVGRYDRETGEHHPTVYPTGSFVYRQSSYDRERSASFYTPEVLTKFTVEQALEVLDEQNVITKAEDYLHLTVCEPAMGSGAFAVQAVRQLAERYLDMREEELAKEQGDDHVPLDPENRPAEIQKVKAYIALHNVYGLDLNNTAVELGQIALWLDSMTPGLRAPWFGLHLRAGNALIGANRTTFDAKDLAKDASKKKPASPWLDTPADEYNAEETFEGKIYSFLLPSPTWGAVTSKVETHVKKRFGDEIKTIKEWVKSVSKPNLLAPVPFKVNRPYQIKTVTNSAKYGAGDITRLEFLEQLSMRINQLWEFAATRLELAEKQIQRDLHIWGYDPQLKDREVTRQQIEESLENPNSALQRLKLVMDIWCALKFWPIIAPTDSSGNEIEPPSYDEILEAIDAIIGDYVPATSTKNGQISFGEITTWESLEAAESENFALAFTNVDEDIDHVFSTFPWLEAVRDITKDQNFFHWELMFAQVFANGGFNLVVGNPPWVRPRTDEKAALAEMDPWWVLAKKATQQEQNQARDQLLSDEAFLASYVRALSVPTTTSRVISDQTLYAELVNQQPDLYRTFMIRSWEISNQSRGIVGLIHPESHFTEEGAAPLRHSCYQRLRRHFHFHNLGNLFDIDANVVFGVHVYTPSSENIRFIQMTNLLHPSTASDSLKYMPQGGDLPTFKDNQGRRDLRPHASRVQHVDQHTLESWSAMIPPLDGDVLNTRMIYTINSVAESILAKMTACDRLTKFDFAYSPGWHETADRKRHRFEHGYIQPSNWDNTILQGPHLGVATPCSKLPHEIVRSNHDWSPVDFTLIADDFIPTCSYTPSEDQQTYDEEYPRAVFSTGKEGSHRGYFRVGWRHRAATAGYRTMYPAIIPPGTAHVYTIVSAAAHMTNQELTNMVLTCGTLASLPLDFFVRSLGLSDLLSSTVSTLPIVEDPRLIELTLRLNCISEAYNPLYEKLTGQPWSHETPIRDWAERQRAMAEIDVIVAKAFGITLEELIFLYTKMFPTFYTKDQAAALALENHHTRDYYYSRFFDTI